MINIRKRNNKWEVSFYYDCPTTGKRKRFRRSSPYPTKRQTNKWAQQQQELCLNPIEEKEAAITFNELADLYLERASGFLKPSTLSMRTYRINGKLREFFGALPIDEITPLLVDNYVVWRTTGDNPVKNTTARGELACLSSMLGEAVRWQLLDVAPQFKRPRMEPVEWLYLEEEEAQQFLDANREHPLIHNIVLFLLNTGLRIGEALALRWSHIDMERKQLTVQASYTNGVTSSPKSNKWRTIPLNESALYALDGQMTRIRRRNDLVFCGPNGEQLNKDQLRLPLERAIKRAGIRKFTPHDLRHTFASWLVQRGTSLQVVKALLGHSDIKTTERYAHLAPATLEQGVDVLGTIWEPTQNNEQEAKRPQTE